MAFAAIDEKISTFLTQPLLLVARSKAGTLWQSKEAFELANEPKELVVLESAFHFDMYDIPEYVDQAATKLTEFFDKNLNNLVPAESLK